MKALSVRQPWANLIASGRKTIETRPWATRYRGRLLIVSSKRGTEPPFGVAVATATLVRCLRMADRDSQAACIAKYTRAYSWILRDIQAIEPFPVRGQLGLFDVDLTDQNTA